MWESRKGNTSVEMAQSLHGKSSQPNISTAEGSPYTKPPLWESWGLR